MRVKQKGLRSGALVFFGLAYLGFLLMEMPADFAYRHWKQSLGAEQPLVMQQISGTIWNGSVGQMMLAGHPVEAMRWRLNPLALLLGRVEASWQFNMAGGLGQGIIGRSVTGDLYLQDMTMQLPAPGLTAFQSLAVFRPKGVLALTLSAMVVSAEGIETLDATLEWRSAQLSLMRSVGLGDLLLTTSTQTDEVHAVVKDRGGPLSVEALFTLKPDGQYQLRGSLAVRDTRQAALVQAINNLGRPGDDGRTTIAYGGVWQDYRALFFKE